MGKTDVLRYKPGQSSTRAEKTLLCTFPGVWVEGHKHRIASQGAGEYKHTITGTPLIIGLLDSKVALRLKNKR